MRIAPFIIILLFVLSACQKGELQDAGGTRLSKVVSRWHDSVSIRYFHYDLNGRVINTLDTNNNYYAVRTSYTYDGEGKLMSTDASQTYTENSVTYQKGHLTQSFEYSNRRLEKKFSSTSAGYSKKNIYVYDTKGRLILDSSYSWFVLNELAAYTRFTYNDNDDVIEWEYFVRPFGTWQSAGTYHVSYNSSLNPYYTTGQFYYVALEDNIALSRHLRTQESWQGDTATYSYEYYSNGLLKKITMDETITEFFYE